MPSTLSWSASEGSVRKVETSERRTLHALLATLHESVECIWTHLVELGGTVWQSQGLAEFVFSASRLGAILLYWSIATTAKHVRPSGAKVGSLGLPHTSATHA